MANPILRRLRCPEKVEVIKAVANEEVERPAQGIGEEVARYRWRCRPCSNLTFHLGLFNFL